LRRDWDTSWERPRLFGGVPYLPHGALLASFMIPAGAKRIS
jgi:hypothetical protein